MKIGFCSGSFDPFTNGHLHVVKEASKLFDQVIIGIGVNPEKKRRFDPLLMRTTIEKVLASNNLTNVKVIHYTGLTGQTALYNGATAIVRGLRNGMDYQKEENEASTTQEIFGIDTVYIRAGSLGNVSSSMVMELLKYGQDVSKYVPAEILTVIKK